MTKENTGFYSGPIIAKLLGVTPRRLQQLASDGVIPKPERGLYSLSGSITGYIKFIRDNQAGRETSDYTKVRTSLTEHQTIKLKRENDLADLQLVPREEVLEVTKAAGKVISEASTKLYSPKLIKDLCALDGPAHIRERLKTVTQSIREEIAEKFLAMAKRGNQHE